MEPIDGLTGRTREIFRRVVEAYLERGEPVGSQMIAPSLSLSPASVRGVMAALEARGLLTHPHTSAGRIPTDTGLRLFVDGMMQVARPRKAERAAIEQATQGAAIEQALDQATQTLAGLAACAGVVLSPRADRRLKQLSFVPLDAGRALAVLVALDGSIENRVVALAPGTSAAQLAEVGAFVSDRLSGLTLAEAEARLTAEVADRRAAIDRAAALLVAEGLAQWSRDAGDRPVLIVRGQAHLLDPERAADLERVRQLLEELDDRQEIIRLLASAQGGQGVRLFIGAENRLFALSGSSVIAAPWHGPDGQVVGVVGVIGPVRLNYARIVPMVDFTAQALTRRMS